MLIICYTATILEIKRSLAIKVIYSVWKKKMTKSKAYTTSSCYGGPQLSEQNQKLHGKNKNLTAKPKTLRQKQRPHGKNKYFRAKPNTSQQKQTLMAKPKLFCFCCEVFGFAVMFLFLLWGILFLPWGFWFCHEVFCFCCEVFGFAVIFWFLLRGFWFCRDSCGPP